jgi:hypothetical protein
MRGLKEADAATSILSGLKLGLMQDEAYEEFRSKFLARMSAGEKEREDLLRRNGQSIHQIETRHANIMRSVEDGDGDGLASFKQRLKELEADLEATRAKP